MAVCLIDSAVETFEKQSVLAKKMPTHDLWWFGHRKMPAKSGSLSHPELREKSFIPLAPLGLVGCKPAKS